MRLPTNPSRKALIMEFRRPPLPHKPVQRQRFRPQAPVQPCNQRLVRRHNIPTRLHCRNTGILAVLHYHRSTPQKHQHRHQRHRDRVIEPSDIREVDSTVFHVRVRKRRRHPVSDRSVRQILGLSLKKFQRSRANRSESSNGNFKRRSHWRPHVLRSYLSLY